MAAKNKKQMDMNQRMKIIEERMSLIRYKVVVMSGKGGVGKTTVAVNLAMKLASLGYTVGILDVDITGPNVPHMLQMEGKIPTVSPQTNTFSPVIGPMNVRVMSMAFLLQSNQTPVIWRGPMKMGAIRQFLAEAEWGLLDYMVFDLPPGTSDETLDILQIIKGAGVVVVTTPQDVAVLDARKTVNMARELNKPASKKYENALTAFKDGHAEKEPDKPVLTKMLGIIENMSGFICPHCGEEVDLYGSGGGERASETMGVPFLGKIPFEIDVRIQSDKGLPFILKYPDSKSGLAFENIVKTITKEMEK
ncbi:MAG: Mrp/NBP35 family ATP-binding protein [Promethearchaeota archaeon]